MRPAAQPAADHAARLEALEGDHALVMALIRTLSDRLAMLEGREPPDTGAMTTIKRAAGESGFSETTIRRKIARGEIAARKIGGRVLVSLAK
jgi:hypothetical protein